MMICKHCGAVIEDGKNFCSECGAPAEVHTVIVRDGSMPDKAEINSSARNVMIFGIVGLAVGYLYNGIAGIILCAIGRKKAKEHEEQYGELSGKAKVGSTLSLIGLILSILQVIVVALVVIGVILFYGAVIWAFITAALHGGGQIDLSGLDDLFTYIPHWM